MSYIYRIYILQSSLPFASGGHQALKLADLYCLFYVRKHNGNALPGSKYSWEVNLHERGCFAAHGALPHIRSTKGTAADVTTLNKDSVQRILLRSKMFWVGACGLAWCVQVYGKITAAGLMAFTTQITHRFCESPCSVSMARTCKSPEAFRCSCS